MTRHSIAGHGGEPRDRREEHSPGIAEGKLPAQLRKAQRRTRQDARGGRCRSGSSKAAVAVQRSHSVSTVRVLTVVTMFVTNAYKILPETTLARRFSKFRAPLPPPSRRNAFACPRNEGLHSAPPRRGSGPRPPVKALTRLAIVRCGGSLRGGTCCLGGNQEPVRAPPLDGVNGAIRTVLDTLLRP